jgi:hypothetical protein
MAVCTSNAFTIENVHVVAARVDDMFKIAMYIYGTTETLHLQSSYLAVPLPNIQKVAALSNAEVQALWPHITPNLGWDTLEWVSSLAGYPSSVSKLLNDVTKQYRSSGYHLREEMQYVMLRPHYNGTWGGGLEIWYKADHLLLPSNSVTSGVILNMGMAYLMYDADYDMQADSKSVTIPLETLSYCPGPCKYNDWLGAPITRYATFTIAAPQFKLLIETTQRPRVPVPVRVHHVCFITGMVFMAIFFIMMGVQARKIYRANFLEIKK